MELIGLRICWIWSTQKLSLGRFSFDLVPCIPVSDKTIVRQLFFHLTTILHYLPLHSLAPLGPTFADSLTNNYVKAKTNISVFTLQAFSHNL